MDADMDPDPDPDMNPGIPDSRGAFRYLWWLVVRQRRRVALGALLGTAWTVGLALPPYVLSRAVDDGLVPGRWDALAGWAGVFLGAGAVNAWLAIMRHRTMTKVRMDAAFRTVRVVTEHSTLLGAVLPRKVTAGEVVAIGISDVFKIGRTLTVTGPGVGAVVAYAVVAVLLLAVSPLLAAVVLLGVPVLAVVVGPLLGRLHGVEAVYREHESGLAARIADFTGGLRVLNGFGGADMFAERFRNRSRALQAEGYRVGAVTSWIQALGVGLPVVFLAAVTWLAARMAAEGTITVGELVAVYGYVAVLVVPVTFFIEGGYEISRGLVAAARVVRFLNLEPASTGRQAGSGAPESPSVLRDPESGVELTPGSFAALVSARPAESAAVLDRLGGFTESAATWDGVGLHAMPLEQIRDRILVADNEADLFAGTVRDVLAGRRDRDDDDVSRAVHTAVAEDVVRGLPAGLDSMLDAQGRNLSGGQRQRIRLARALLAEPEVLLAHEPTSSLDSPTEAVVAARLRATRAGRTTMVSSTSPLLLEQTDIVYYLVGGEVAASGPHRELLRAHAGYRGLVSRADDDRDDDSDDRDVDGDDDGDDDGDEGGSMRHAPSQGPAYPVGSEP